MFPELPAKQAAAICWALARSTAILRIESLNVVSDRAQLATCLIDQLRAATSRASSNCCRADGCFSRSANPHCSSGSPSSPAIGRSSYRRPPSNDSSSSTSEIELFGQDSPSKHLLDKKKQGNGCRAVVRTGEVSSERLDRSSSPRRRVLL